MGLKLYNPADFADEELERPRLALVQAGNNIRQRTEDANYELAKELERQRLILIEAEVLLLDLKKEGHGDIAEEVQGIIDIARWRSRKTQKNTDRY